MCRLNVMVSEMSPQEPISPILSIAEFSNLPLNQSFLSDSTSLGENNSSKQEEQDSRIINDFDDISYLRSQTAVPEPDHGISSHLDQSLTSVESDDSGQARKNSSSHHTTEALPALVADCDSNSCPVLQTYLG